MYIISYKLFFLFLFFFVNYCLLEPIYKIFFVAITKLLFCYYDKMEKNCFYL